MVEDTAGEYVKREREEKRMYVCAKEPGREQMDERHDTEKADRREERHVQAAGARDGHWMTQQPLPVPPWDWYGSSARGTGPHTEGTCSERSVPRRRAGERRVMAGWGDGAWYARGDLLSFCNTG